MNRGSGHRGHGAGSGLASVSPVTTEDRPSDRISRQHRNTALLVAGCFFMEMLDGTIVSTAAPRLGAALRVAPTSISLVISAYLLALAMTVPLGGWLARRFGARPVFLAAIAGFTLASAGCAASGSLAMLVGTRAAQGVCGALMVPVGQTLVMSRTEKRHLMRVASYVIWPGLIAPVVAPLIGALIVTHLTWQWMFLVNVPLGVLAFGAAWRLVGSDPPEPVAPFDWSGMVLTVGGISLITYAAHIVSDDAGRGLVAAGCAVAAAVLAVLAVRHLRRSPRPLLNLSTMSSPGFRSTQIGGSLARLVVGATPFLLPLLFQTAFGWSPVRSGSLVLFVFVGNILIKPATTPLINRLGYRMMLLISTVGLALTTVCLGLLTAATPTAVIALTAAACGVFRSTGMSAYFTVGLADLPRELSRDANVLTATVTQVTNGLAVAVAALALGIGRDLGRGVGRTGPDEPFTVAFALLGVVSLAAGAQAFRLDPGIGNEARTANTANTANTAKSANTAEPARTAP